MPDGACTLRHPPCRPRPSLRSYRGRLCLLLVGLVLAPIAAFGVGGSGLLGFGGALDMMDPGPLSDVHRSFVADCAGCHEPHGAGADAWWTAANAPGRSSEKCAACHAFAGPAQLPHNRVFAARPDMQPIACLACHTEHKGASARLVTIADKQCHSCHRVQFDSFAKDHPAFGRDFPHRRRTAIAFDHIKHLRQHFSNPRFTAKVPGGGCIGCHDTARAGRRVPLKPFATTCAACHESQIGERDLVVLTFPELSANPFDKEVITEACGPVAAENGESQDEDYESVSDLSLGPVGAYLLRVDGEDADAYTEKIGALVTGMAENGAEPIAELITGRDGDAARLLKGLSPELVKAAACAWAGNEEYEAPNESQFGGWFADELTLRYRAMTHADPVLRAWLDHAVTANTASKGPHVDLREAIASRTEGPGSCTGCHAISTVRKSGENAGLMVDWHSDVSQIRRHMTYSHVPHINLLGPGAWCGSCHVADPKAEFSAAFDQYDPMKPAGNFKPIEVATCAGCHAAGQVRQDCQMCHDYHDRPVMKGWRAVDGDLFGARSGIGRKF